MKNLTIVAFLLFLITGVTLAEDLTNHALLEELKTEFDVRWEVWQGPAYQKAIQQTTGFYGEINADPTRQLMGIDEQGNPIIYYTDNYNAALTTRTARIRPGGVSGYDLDGSTIQRLYHWDNSTVNSSHPEFVGRVQNMDGGASDQDHANHTAGTMMASGVQTNAKGMAIDATLYSYDWDFDESEMTTAAGAGAKVSSHSYYSGTGYGAYVIRTRDYDLVANAAPYYLICVSAGNAGPGWDTINSSNAIKNGLVVGAVNDVTNYTGPGSVSTANFSSRGPTNDDRIKPDVVGNGVDLYSCSRFSYTTMSGTSMSTPNVAGSAFLLYEQYHQTHNNAYPLSATIKGVIIHTALECGSWDGPDYRYGWGLMDAEAAAALIEYDVDTDDNCITENQLLNGQTIDNVVNVTGDEPLRVTLCWNDPAAASGANITLINDLDVTVTNLNTNVTTLPWVLNGLTNTPASHGDNTVDNVEQVYIATPSPGSYLISVSHKGTLQGASQPFSLIYTGGTQGEPPEALLTLTPINNYIPPNGARMYYEVDFTYNGVDPRPNSWYWVDAILPNGNYYGPLFQYTTTFTPGQHIARNLSLRVPAMAPAGTYSIIGKVGTYPETVIAQDEFEMVKFGTTVGDGSWPQDTQIASDGDMLNLPAEFAMSEAYPNPFNPSTTVAVNLPETSELTVNVYNVQGRLVTTLANGTYTAGQNQLTFDASNLASGLYFIRATVPGHLDQVQTVMLMR